MKSKLLGGILLLLLALQTSGCGTLMFSDRQGQSPGRVDPNVVILDGIGLLLFLVPGLVAFAVDFSSGAIYLPPDVKTGEGPFFRDPSKVEVTEVSE